MTQQYRKKPVVIEAIQWSGENDAAVEDFTKIQWNRVDPLDLEDEEEKDDKAQVFDVLHGTWVLMKEGDWVIKGLKGEFYPCTNEAFEASYEPIEVTA